MTSKSRINIVCSAHCEFGSNITVDDITYHVQTEDKGRSNPVVESLVYARGEILYSRRTPYRELLEQKVDNETIATLMERQHRAIVDAVAEGGLDRLAKNDADVAADDDTTITHSEVKKARPSKAIAARSAIPAFRRGFRRRPAGLPARPRT